MTATPHRALLAIDQGTTSTRAIVFSAEGTVLSIRQKELALHCPQKGWVEQDPEAIWRDTLAVCRQAVEDVQQQAMSIAAIGIANQRETTVIWDRKTGTPVYNAIVWQDRRSADYCLQHAATGVANRVTEKTGLLIDPYFSATKIAWILDHVEGVRCRAENGDLAFGTIDSFLLWRLSGGKTHATDITNASRTLLFDIQRLCWDDDLLAYFNIPSAILPAVKANVADFGCTSPDLLGESYRIGAMAGDQHAALVGHGCFAPGMIKATYGTGCFALMNTGSDKVASNHRLLSTIGYQIDAQPCYALEGAIFTAGAVIQWLRDNLGIIADAPQSEAVALSVADSNEVYFVPAFNGLGAPYWQPGTRAAITGLSRESNRAHIVRAALEAQGYQTRDLLTAMAADCGESSGQAIAKVLRIDGGMASNTFFCQFLADMVDRPVEIPAVMESTAWGAAALAGLQSNLFAGLDDIANRWSCARRYTPNLDAAKRNRLYQGWQAAVSCVLH